MTDRWQRELTKLRRAELPDDVWERVVHGPRLDPLGQRGRSRVVAAVVAFALFAAAALFALRAIGPLRSPLRTLGGGSDVAAVPPVGQTAAGFLPDGRPVFVVHHEDGSLSVVDAFSSHRAWGFEEPVEWCPSTRQFVEWAHEAHFDEYGAWESAGPAPTGLATFAYDVVGRDASGDPAAIRVGSMRPPDPSHSPSETKPSRPPFCPVVAGRSNEIVTHTIDWDQIWDSPADAVAAAPEGWIAVRGTLLVSHVDGFVQMCAVVLDGRCEGRAFVRGIDGVGLMVNVLKPYPGSAYEEPQIWLARVRDGVLDDIAITTFFHTST